MQLKPNKSWLLLGVGMLLGAGVAHAADSRYDEASATITKATKLLNAIGDEKSSAASQRKRAVRALERAQMRIACAKAVADSGKPGCPGAKDDFDDNGDDKGEKEAAEKGKEGAGEKTKESAQKSKAGAGEKTKEGAQKGKAGAGEKTKESAQKGKAG